MKCGPISNNATAPTPRAALRAAAMARVATAVGRIWSRSEAIGLPKVSPSGVAPNKAAVALGMKLNVTHSAMPAPASTRRAKARRVWAGVSVAWGMTPSTGSEAGGMLSSPRRRRISSIRSVSGSITRAPSVTAASTSGAIAPYGSSGVPAATSLRQAGTLTVTLSASRAATVKPRRCNASICSSGATSTPPSPATRAKRKVAVRRQPGSAPASATLPGSPPHSSITIRVAAVSASGISEASIPRSNRLRASDATP